MERIRKIAGITAGIAVGLFLFCEIAKGLNYIYVPDSEWERIVMHHFYEDEGKIDNLFLGSSHLHNDIDPFLLDERNGQYNFNLATPAQLMNGTYYLLREADKKNHLSHVYIEMYYNYHVKDDDNTEPIITEPFRNWQVTDYMKFSYNKLAYMDSIADMEEYPGILLPFSRYRSELDNWDHIKATMAGKKGEEYINFKSSHYFEDGNGYEECREKGYRYSTRIYQDRNRLYEQGYILAQRSLAETSEYYLREVISYCQKKNIPVTLFVSPIYELQVISTEGYDDYTGQIREIADEYDVDFYDFNLAKDEYLPIQQTKYFMDVEHLNADGAALFTDFFWQVVSADETDNERYFYDSYIEKLESKEPELYGIYYREDEQVKRMRIASNRETGMEYRIVLTPTEPEGNVEYMVQDFGENKDFTVDGVEHGTCTITCRISGKSEPVQEVEIEY